MTSSAPAKGTYLLLVRLDQGVKIAVGRRGTYSFHAGWYTYSGSALGPGGIQARLTRHHRASKRKHWHIDYLMAYGALKTSWQVESSARLECAWAEAIRQLPTASIPVPGFGSSDCRCVSHLAHLSRRPLESQIRDALESASPGSVLHHIHYTDVTGR